MKEVYPKLSSPGFLAFLLSWLFAKTQFLLFQNQPGRRQRDPRDRRHGWPLHRPHSEDLESGAGVCHHDRQLRILQALLLDEKRQQMIILLVVVKKRSTLGWRKIQGWFINVVGFQSTADIQSEFLTFCKSFVSAESWICPCQNKRIFFIGFVLCTYLLWRQ